ncbi:AMP-binding enzyme [Micromonospora haikouensis]|uniref:AMP-binding enzyme n=1 Tax=Micromonospora haikouensis TaxID=686309 RepID=A0A1C4XH01_9ACTN|nr:non-ribosomal peptide synthetase [Micromonospora haikouensis]SCF07637.1 AMP-binding enzyme [Micromonospora haikouensis]
MRVEPALFDDLLDPVGAWGTREPDRVAVTTRGGSLRYAALAAAAGKLAATLAPSARNDDPHRTVALCVRPDGTLPVALLAALAAGVEPLVVDSSWPLPAVAGLARLTGVGMVVAAADDLCRWSGLGAGPVLPVPVRGPRAHLAGTGATAPGGYVSCPVWATDPAAVHRLSRAVLTRSVATVVADTGIGPTDTVLYRGGATCGVAPLRMLPALAAGARLVLAGRDERQHLVFALEAVRREAATVVELTATEVRLLLGAGDRLAYLLLAARETLRVVWLVAGTLDSQDEETLRRLLGVRVAHTDGTTGLGPSPNAERVPEPGRVGPESGPPAAPPDHLVPAPEQRVPNAGAIGRPGVAGTVLIAGVPGDPAAIERTIAGHPAVAHAQLSLAGPAGLTARVRLADPDPVDPFDTMVLVEWLESMLPPELVPRTVVVDGIAPDPVGPDPEILRAWLPRVRDIVATVLEGVRVEPTDNFFALGGNSLRTALLVDQINDDLGVELSIGAVMESPTVADLAALVAAAAGAAPPRPAEAAQPTQRGDGT